MDLDFTKVSYEGDLSDFSEDELRELVGEFESAQESNVAEFENAVEAVDGIDENKIEDFEEARQGLIEDITEADAFDEVPLSEDKLEGESFSELQDWRDFVAGVGGGAPEDDPEGDDDDPEGEGSFEDMGTKSPADPGDEADEFVEDELGQIQGLNL